MYQFQKVQFSVLYKNFKNIVQLCGISQTQTFGVGTTIAMLDLDKISCGYTGSAVILVPSHCYSQNFNNALEVKYPDCSCFLESTVLM